VTSPCPVESAVVLPDRHVVKMALETCQLISIIYSKWYYDWGYIPKKDGLPYSIEKGAFRNHPCTQWAAKSHENLAWLIRHGYALCNEYRHRYEKEHSCMKSLEVAENIFATKSGKEIFIYKNVVEFTRAMPDEFKMDTSIDTFEAYKMYIASKLWVASNYLRMPSRKPEWI
jgi:Pyrimidine dimer DNA glycosylase